MMKIAIMIRNKPETRFSQATTVRRGRPQMRAAANCLDRAVPAPRRRQTAWRTDSGHPLGTGRPGAKGEPAAAIGSARVPGPGGPSAGGGGGAWLLGGGTGTIEIVPHAGHWAWRPAVSSGVFSNRPH